MPGTNPMTEPQSFRFENILITEITVIRKERQRRNIDISDLLPSIQQDGLLQPIIVRNKIKGEDPQTAKPNILVAGERRLEACTQLGWKTIPCHHLEALDTVTAEVLELIENIKRHQLPWQDEVRAVEKLHKLKKQTEKHWNQEKLSQLIGMSHVHTKKYLRIAVNIDDARIQASGGIVPAFNLLMRIDERRIADTVAEMAENVGTIFTEKTTGVKPPVRTSPTPTLEELRKAPKPKPAKESILKEDFLKWAPEYSGPKFNLIHCDFPYSAGALEGPFGAGRGAGLALSSYDDTRDVFWVLLRCLCENIDNIMSLSGHMMFWFSMEYYNEIRLFFAKHAPDLHIQNMPLIWMKSDNSGIMSDPRRRPRNICETCFIISRGDRHILDPVSNGYHSPTDRTGHPHTKPEPMLRHFMRMFVDNETKMFDPTCGSGSSLRAAESLGAKHVVGLETNAEFIDFARQELNSFRILQKAYRTKGTPA